jgi:GTP-binding protein
VTFTLAIIGRPNVGKSTLFNRLAGKKLAIVHDQPGVTRDWREAEGTLYDRTFKIIDTAGLEERFDESIPARMRKKTEDALARADVALFIIDGHEGVTTMDRHFADWLRKQGKPVILAINKCENENTAQSGVAEAYKLGFGEPITLSAEHKIGFEDLFHAVDKLFPLAPDNSGEDEKTERFYADNDKDLDAIEGLEDYEFIDQEPEEKSLKIAIVGRPNVGKSTLLNAIIKEERSMTGPEAGITRDAIAVEWTYKDRPFRLVDTAGMRRKARIHDAVEKMSVDDSLRAIRLAQVVILVIDGTVPLEKQDIQIADLIIREGRALVLAVNKWDAVDDHQKTIDELKYKMDISLAQLKDIPWITLSAQNGKNIERLLDTVLSTYAIWNTRIKTSGLNRWLAKVESRNAPPLVDGRANRLKYVTQIKARPPTFALWASRDTELPESYRRYLINALRTDFKIPGVPIRFMIRRSKNPYKS